MSLAQARRGADLEPRLFPKNFAPGAAAAGPGREGSPKKAPLKGGAKFHVHQDLTSFAQETARGQLAATHRWRHPQTLASVIALVFDVVGAFRVA